MSFFSGKKLLLFGFIVVLLIAIPVTVYLVGQQQKTKSGATAATTLLFDPATPQAKTIAVGDPVSFDIYVDPSEINQVNFIQLSISYDATKLATADAAFTPAPWPAADGTTFTPSIPLGPDYTPGNISVSMSVGGSFQNVIKTRTKIATVTFKAVAPTDSGIATKISFGDQSQVLSSDSTSGGGENVLSSNSSTGSVNITAGAAATGTPTDTPTPTTADATATPTDTPTPTTDPNVTTTITDTPTPTTIPLCTNFTIDGDKTGIAPYSLNFTVAGASPDTTTISKVSYDFGDGQTQDVIDSGGVGTASVSVVTSHTYATSGTFNANATLTETDPDGTEITTEKCSPIAITVSDTTSPTTAAAPSPLPPTGPTGLITVGAIGLVLTFIGALLLLAL